MSSGVSFKKYLVLIGLERFPSLLKNVLEFLSKSALFRLVGSDMMELTFSRLSLRLSLAELVAELGGKSCIDTWPVCRVPDRKEIESIRERKTYAPRSLPVSGRSLERIVRWVNVRPDSHSRSNLTRSSPVERLIARRYATCGNSLTALNINNLSMTDYPRTLPNLETQSTRYRGEVVD